MIRSLLDNYTIYDFIAGMIVLCTAIPVHEFAHAWAADRMGDPTARLRRRVSFNPLDHIDPIGALMILFLGFGFAKPVPVNSMNFRNRKAGIVVTSLAGPVSNILLAALSLSLCKLLTLPYALLGRPALLSGVGLVLWYTVQVNLSLAVFNLLPLPPLDGFNAISPLLPQRLYWQIARYSQQIVWVVVLLAVVFDLFTVPVGFLTEKLYEFIDMLTMWIDLLLKVVL